jgi:hypothetical protein
MSFTVQASQNMVKAIIQTGFIIAIKLMVRQGAATVYGLPSCSGAP